MRKLTVWLKLPPTEYRPNAIRVVTSANGFAFEISRGGWWLLHSEFEALEDAILFAVNYDPNPAQTFTIRLLSSLAEEQLLPWEKQRK